MMSYPNLPNLISLQEAGAAPKYSTHEEAIFSSLINKHGTKLKNIIYSIVRDEELAQDLLQEAYTKALITLRKGGYQEEGKFVAWVARIAHNLAIDTFRKQKRYPSTPIEENDRLENDLGFHEECVEAKQIREETIAKLHQLIEQLPAAQREVVELRHFQQMSFQEIAQATHVSINTALGRMRYALINLRKQISQHNIQLDLPQG